VGFVCGGGAALAWVIHLVEVEDGVVRIRRRAVGLLNGIIRLLERCRTLCLSLSFLFSPELAPQQRGLGDIREAKEGNSLGNRNEVEEI